MTRIDSGTVEQLYRRYYPALQTKCARMLRDRAEAEDVAQETFARLWNSRAGIDDPNAVLAWLYRTSTRLAVDRLRRRGRSVAVEDLAPPLRDPASEHDEEARANTRRLLAEIANHVPARELEVALLSRIDGLTHDEIGEVTKRSGRTVRRLLARFDERVRAWSDR